MSQCRSPRRKSGMGRRRNNHHHQNRTQHPRGPRQQQRQQASTSQANVSEVLMAEALVSETVENEANNASLDDAFILDSGSTHNMCSDRKWMISYHPFLVAREVRLGGSRTLRAQGSGVAEITFASNGRSTTVQLKDVLYVPKLRRNLISMSQLADDGFEIQVKKDTIALTNGDSTLTAERKNGLYVLEPTNPVESNAAEGKVKKISLASAHRIFAHINAEWLRKMIERDGHQVINDFKGCNTCIKGKMHQASFKSVPASANASRPGWISTDLCSVSTPSYGQHHHFLTLTDHFSRFRKVYFVKTKDETYDRI